jgi:hypothetical protein
MKRGVARASKRRRWKFEKPRSGATDGTGSLVNKGKENRCKEEARNL